ncbi:protein kinase [Archangium violaceum]|uniref:protein kinase domain-containing protein n=1 Tax=Archangium violaceum TaxID=83451 RepID=UPI002B3247A6|nr:protein kinase [Archangium violaceum]
MSEEALREDVRVWTSLGMRGSAGASESGGDSFLREVLQVEPTSRLPVLGERLGGPEGGRFEILAPMGRGGMGQVFRARDETLRREVALKFLLPRPGFEELALAEARAVARLDHENIVRIFDVAEWSRTPGRDRVPFLVMECLEGESLAALLERERPTLRRALEMLEAIASGLAHAHARGIVHRDLKPGNVFLTREGAVKLLDFGLSYLAVEPVRSKLQPIGGTPAYMAPEQWRGEAQDPRTDIWAAGVVLYELLTGEPPFQGATMAELRERVTSAEPAPLVRVRHPEVPRQVEVLLATALAKEPARRFSSALELREELRELRGRLLGARRQVRGPTAEPQRRQVTLVSCQLGGLALAEGGATLDTEDVGELELAFHEACVELVERHGGSVALSMGGEVLASFGWTQGREDDSERAVRAALQLTGELRGTLQQRLPHLPLSGVFVRGGVHTELMAVGPRLQGEASKMAVWLARQAGPGGVAISDSTWKLVRGAFLHEPLGIHSFEGLSGSVRMDVHRVVGEREVASRFDRSRVAGSLSPLVGRERELGLLLELWEQARRGQGSFVLVSGEAGIGKSRLIEALCEHVAESSSLIRVQCWSRFSTHALHPVIELLQMAVGIQPEDAPPLRLEKLEERMRQLRMPQEDTHMLALLLSLPIPKDSPVLQLTPERLRERTFASLACFFLRCPCDAPPKLLVIEDLHWADSSLLEWLGDLLARVGSAGVLVVLSARPEFQPDWSRHPGFHRLVVERLSAGSAAALARAVAGARELSEETVQALVEKTDGVPLFIEEMTRMVLEGGAAASIPLTLHELLLARLDMLPSRQKALAQVCAVMGRDFSHALLAAVAEREESLLRRELSGLMEAGLLREQVGVEERAYQFRHALLQDAAYQSLSRSARRRYHQRIVRVLEDRFPQVVEARPEVLAHHLTEEGEHARALDAWERAGQLALERQECPEALGHLTRALELLPVLADAEPRLQRELGIRMALGFAMMQVQGFDVRETERMFDRVWELIHQMGEALPRRGLPFWNLFAYCHQRAEYHRAKELAERLVSLGRSHGQLELRSLGFWMNAAILSVWGRPREAAEELERALGIPELPLEAHRARIVRYGASLWAIALADGAIVHTVLGRMEESRRWAREALEQAGRVDEAYTLGFTQVHVAIACMLRRDVREALTLVEQAILFASERRFVLWRTWATLVRGGCLAELGRPHEGLALAREVLASWRSRGIRNGIPYNLAVIAKCQLALGQAQEALASLDEALVESAATGELQGDAVLHQLRGEGLMWLGREEEAHACFVRAIAVAREQGAGLFELRATVSLCRLLWDRGQSEAARRMLEPVYRRFEGEGECVDLQEAQVLLADCESTLSYG